VLGHLVPSADNPLEGALRATPFAAYTAPFNVTGQPAISLPLYWSSDGLPIGVQLIAASGREDLLIRVAAQLEEARPWADRRPPIHA
jgi:amidase